MCRAPAPAGHSGHAHACALHGQHREIVWRRPLPLAADARHAFWGALGCSCFVF